MPDGQNFVIHKRTVRKAGRTLKKKIQGLLVFTNRASDKWKINAKQKGIENVLQALPTVIKKHPDVVYIILGATHPHILKAYGDAHGIG